MAEIVTANVSIGDSRVVGATFNVPMLLAAHFAWADRYRDYTGIDEVAADFDETDPIYIGAQAAFSQESKEGTSLAKLRIGRQRIGVIGSEVSSTLATPSLVATITVTEVLVDGFYVLKIGGTAYGYLAVEGDDETDVADGWATAIDAAADYTATNAGAIITVTKTTAGAFSYAAWVKEANDSGELVDTDGVLFTVGGTATYSITADIKYQTEAPGTGAYNSVTAFTGIAASDTYAVAAVSTGADTISIAGNHVAQFYAGRAFTVAGSTGNDGAYVVISSVFSTPNTVISVALVASAVADGNVVVAQNETDVVARLDALFALTEFTQFFGLTDLTGGAYKVDLTGTNGAYVDYFKIAVDARQTLQTGYSLERDTLTSPWYDEAGDITNTVSAALTAITNVDPNWYGLVMLDQAQSVQEAAATAIEALSKLHVVSSEDTDILDPASTTDVAYVLKGLTRHRTMPIYADNGSQFADLAMFADRLPNFPGASTFAGHELEGVNKLRLTTTQEGAVFGKNANIHVNLGGQGATQFGTAASGRFMDLMWLKDYVESDLATTLTRIILAVPKIPMTDPGLQTLVDGATNRANFYIANNLFAPFVSGGKTVPYVLSVMKAADIGTTDRNNRHLPSGWLTLTMQFANAVHTMVINVTGTI